MSNHNKRLLKHGLFIFAGLMLLSGCSTSKQPYAVVESTDSEQSVNTTIEANITPQQPRETVIYEPEHPETYIVQKGDTLWDISANFLRDPWFWPEIWYKNPQVDNPHLIYPGDELAIVYIGGEKRIQLIRRGETGQALSSTGMKIVKLSPRIRAQSIDASIPSIPIESIRQLLEKPLIIDEEDLAKAAYVLDSRSNHLANAINDTLYVRKLDTKGNGRFQIFRPNKPLIDTVTGEVLGYEALYVAEAKLERGGDPASVRVTSSSREILRDDRVLPIDNSNLERDFFPRPPKQEVRGTIISLLDGISQLGQYQTVAINLGLRDGISTGNVLAVDRVGKVIIDRNEEEKDFQVKLPDERIGLIMVIRAYDKMSFALIMEAHEPIRLNEIVHTP
ncbi:MAG: LysM peptidoglycan-binding domain-containing protein [Gammaproteobacteria bacterium]|nr:LysM peptidoglycan-binding domain-containing protein [Gammaproteobacteria bacterium]MBL6999375.1 LysM peptidoglycan-binding domain-containing protein [Gammaproteobacteria bacterium]